MNKRKFKKLLNELKSNLDAGNVSSFISQLTGSSVTNEKGQFVRTDLRNHLWNCEQALEEGELTHSDVVRELKSRARLAVKFISQIR